MIGSTGSLELPWVETQPYPAEHALRTSPGSRWTQQAICPERGSREQFSHPAEELTGLAVLFWASRHFHSPVPPGPEDGQPQGSHCQSGKGVSSGRGHAFCGFAAALWDEGEVASVV